MTTRAERRHQERRIKDKWVKFIKRILDKDSPTYPLIWKRGGVTILGRKQEFIEESANRRAHHNKCDCDLCRKPRYDRLKDQPSTDD